MVGQTNMFPAVGASPALCWCFLVFWKMPEPLNREIHDAITHSTSSSWTVSLSQSLCVSHCHSRSVQPELKRILCSRLVWNITYLTCWWIDGCSQLPPSLLCRLHSGVSLSALFRKIWNSRLCLHRKWLSQWIMGRSLQEPMRTLYFVSRPIEWFAFIDWTGW